MQKTNSFMQKSLIVALCAGVPLSVTTAVSVNWPDAVGVPEIAPVLALIVSPSLLVDESEYLYGVVPPLTVRGDAL